jgi:hypothetical protein
MPKIVYHRPISRNIAASASRKSMAEQRTLKLLQPRIQLSMLENGLDFIGTGREWPARS